MNFSDEFEKCPGVYILTNLINGKTYVGETLNMKVRINRHKNMIDSQFITNAIRKYGILNFNISIEYHPKFSKEELLEREKQLIKERNSLSPNGYNLRPEGRGGRTGIPHSPETKEKMSKSNNGRNNREGTHHSEETKTKMSESAKGRVTPKEIRLKISQLAKERKSGAKAIVQIHPETLQPIKIWDCISDAAEFLGCRSKKTHIVACLKGKYKFAYGFKWEYYNP